MDASPSRPLDRGFAFRGQRVPYLNWQKGVFRAGVQRGPAALSIQYRPNFPFFVFQDNPAERQVLGTLGISVRPFPGAKRSMRGNALMQDPTLRLPKRGRK